MPQETPRPLPNSEEFIHDKKKYFGRFALRHRPEMHKLIEGRVLGKRTEGAEGWRNLAEHNLLAGVVADKIGELVGLPENQRTEVTSVAATHDWDKRLEKERTKGNVGMVVHEENIKTGLVRVTGGDWRDFATWGPKEKILRYVDSGLGQTPDGHADFVNWVERIDDLSNRHPQVNIEGGKIYGKGVLLYDVLGEITGQIETGIHAKIIGRNPDLAQKYPKPEMLTQLIRDQIIEDIEKAPTKNTKIS